MKKLLTEYFLIDGTVFNPERVFPVLSQLKELENLEDGWRFGDGKAPSIETVEAARRAFCRGIGCGIFKGAASPMANGGIALDLYALPLHIEFFILPEGTFRHYIYENDSDLLYEGEGTAWSKLAMVVDQFGELVCRSSESYISANIGQICNDLALEPLKSLAQTAAFRLTNPIVPFLLPDHIALTSQDFIKRLEESQLSFGNSMRMTYRPAIA